MGHLDLVERAAALFDQVVVCVMVNSGKKPMFSLEERMEMASAAVAHIPNARAAACEGLLAHFAREEGAAALVKGARGSGDFDWELQLAQINRDLWPELDTVILPAQTRHLHISSTMVREMIRYRQPLENYLPAPIIPLVEELTEKEGGTHHGQ